MKRVVISLIILIMLPLLAISAFGIYLYFSLDAEMIHFSLSQALPAIKLKNERPENIPSKFAKHTELSLAQMPPLVPRAFVYFSDTYFYTHKFTRKDMLREIFPLILMDRKDRFGGGFDGCYNPDIISKLAIMVLRVTKKRRPLYSEIHVLAFKIDQKYSKEQILQHYLNWLYFGNGIFGVEDASRHYFGKSLADIQPHQITLLYAMHHLGPRWYNNSEILMKFRNRCLESLARGEVISTKEAEEYQRRPLDLIGNNGLW